MPRNDRRRIDSASRVAVVVVVLGVATTGSCEKAITPVAPESPTRLEVVVENSFSIVVRDTTSRTWVLSWSAWIHGPDVINPPRTDRAQVFSLPAPVHVAEISSVLTAPGGAVLQRNVTTAQELIASRVGGNEIRSNTGILTSYGGPITFDTPPAPEARSQVLTTVLMRDGAGQYQQSTATTVFAYELPPPVQCSPVRGQFPIDVRITSTGFEPAIRQAGRVSCVTFINVDSAAHDIRSDPHPDHAACPGLNVGLIPPGARIASAALRTIGTCAYHDERQPDSQTFRGRIEID